jgi:hypothetical protein
MIILESQLAPGALVIADDLNMAADALQSYVPETSRCRLSEVAHCGCQVDRRNTKRRSEFDYRAWLSGACQHVQQAADLRRDGQIGVA